MNHIYVCIFEKIIKGMLRLKMFAEKAFDNFMNLKIISY